MSREGRIRRKEVPAAGFPAMAAEAGRTSDTRKALGVIASYSIRALKCDGCVAFVYSEHERSITPVAVVTRPGVPAPVEEGMSLRLTRSSLFSQCLGSRAVIAREIGPSEQGHEVIDVSGMSGVVLRSMSSDAEPVGLLLLYWNRERPALEPDDIQMVSALADQAASCVIRGRLFSELERSEGKYRVLTENASDMVFSLDGSGRFTYLNARVRDILGYAPESLIGEYFSEIVTPDSWEASQLAMRNAARSGQESFSYEWEALAASGEPRFLDLRASFITRGGEIVGQQGIARDMTEHRRMQEEIERRRLELSFSLKRQSEMQDYVVLVTQVQEEERKRISRELHDDTVQALVALSRQLEMLEHEDAGTGSKRRIADMGSLVDSTLENLRRFTRDLRPPMLDDLGLEPALEWLVQSTSERESLAVTLHVKGEARRLESDVEVAVYRIAQEAVSNVVKHAEASRIQITLEYSPSHIELNVQDDGRGFLPGVERADRAGGLGLVGMQERAEMLGGTLSVESKPGHGTGLSARIPCTRA
ncbi:MAG: PAS domain S-box protein [Bacillota bacterium]|nr:PAS domain S-box protein [Bacillota bacterium]